MTVAAFTGHRPQKLGGFALDNPMRLAIQEALAKKLTELKVKSAISGMALGVDQWAVEVCIALGIPFTAAVPFKGQESVWQPDQKYRYAQLLAKAQEIVVVSDEPYRPALMQIRNEWMVDHCDLLIAVWNGDKQGGTYNCVRYAVLMKRPVHSVFPEISR